jgi:imidazoleglycerol phosphate synthase cyclase subunit
VQFLDLIDAGDPVEAAKAYDAAGADELCFLDITASHEARGILLDVVRRTAEACFMPLTVGGGVRTVEDIRNLLLAGADKVAINTAAVKNPISCARRRRKFGAQCIVVAIDAKTGVRRGEPRVGRSSPMAGASPPASTRSVSPAGRASGRGRVARHLHGPGRHQGGLRSRAGAHHRGRGERARGRVGRRG